MDEPDEISVLIIDASERWGPELQSRLIGLGLQVDVVKSRASALAFAFLIKVDVAVVEFGIEQCTKDLCEALARLDVPHVYMATPLSESNLVRMHSYDGLGVLEGIAA